MMDNRLMPSHTKKERAKQRRRIDKKARKVKDIRRKRKPAKRGVA